MKISKHPTQLFLTTLFSIVLASCSSGGSDSSNNTTVPPTKTQPPAPNTPTPALELSPQIEFNFGEITVGNTAEPLILTITNNLDKATAALNIDSILLTGDPSFLLNLGGGTTPCKVMIFSLSKGESCTVEVTFQPTASGSPAATLEILSDDTNSPAKFSLLGSSREITELNVTINQVEVINCPQVAAFVSVTDQSAFPVKDLTAGDFSIVEGSSSVAVSAATPVASTTYKPIFLSILMDYSQSMDPIDLAAMETEVSSMVDKLKLTDKAEIIKFNKVTYTFDGTTFVVDDPTTNTDDFDTFTSDKTVLKTAIKQSVNDLSGTAYYDALELGINDVKIAEDDAEMIDPKASQRKVVVLITDGIDRNDSTVFTLKSVIENANNNDVSVYVVGIAEGGNSANLKKLANDTTALFYKADVSENLATIFQKQLAALLFSEQYVVEYTSASGGSLDLTVNANMAGIPTGTHTRLGVSCP